MNILINPRPNLLIDLAKNRIVSYETVVAKIDFEKGVIKPAGKFSRTTSKQIQYVAEVLGFAVEKVNKKREDFWMLHQGVKLSYRGALSVTGSKRLITSLADLRDTGLSLVDAYNNSPKRGKCKEEFESLISDNELDIETATKQIEAIRRTRERIF